MNSHTHPRPETDDRQAPSRPLPAVRVVPSGEQPAAAVRAAVRPAPGRRTRGSADEVVPAGVAPAGPDPTPALEVLWDDREPRAGWGGAVDRHLGLRRAGAALARHLVACEARGPVLLDTPPPGGPAALRHLVLGYLLGGLRQDARAARPAPTPPELLVPAETTPETETGADGVSESVSEAVEDAISEALSDARCTAVARALAGAPANEKTPERLTGWMADRLRAAGFETVVYDEAELARRGFGGVLAVGGGSAHPPRVLVARRPGPGTRVLLVGKGITFDTGGISVKPAADLHLMRTDMAGSAAVVAAAERFCADARSGDDAIDLTVVVPSAENMLSGSAYRPGDVVTHLGGITSEVTNTDAEGRMVLADALVHGIEVADPDLVVDVATLTGAMKVALGMRTGAVLGDDEDLVTRIADAGAEAGERWWRLPLVDDLRATVVDSPFADRRQAPPGPGAVTAALFLEGFVDGRPWAHLDIAGPARSPEDLDEVGPVATGFAARTLVGLLRGLVDRPRA